SLRPVILKIPFRGMVKYETLAALSVTLSSDGQDLVAICKQIPLASRRVDPFHAGQTCPRPVTPLRFLSIFGFAFQVFHGTRIFADAGEGKAPPATLFLRVRRLPAFPSEAAEKESKGSQLWSGA